MIPFGKSKAFTVNKRLYRNIAILYPSKNFLFHVAGKVKWNIYDKFAFEEKNLKKIKIKETLTLNEGDILYIPSFLYHESVPLGPRIVISYHFKKEKNANYVRSPWINFIP